MGMFDEIECSVNLPDGFDPTGIKFQTKDLGCDLSLYTIEDGKLFHHYKEYEMVPEAERPDQQNLWIGSMRIKSGSEKLVDTKFHGILNFYGSNIVGSGPQGFMTFKDEPYWEREYNAKFTDGNLESIELIGSNSMDTTKYKHITREEFHRNSRY